MPWLPERAEAVLQQVLKAAHLRAAEVILARVWGRPKVGHLGSICRVSHLRMTCCGRAKRSSRQWVKWPYAEEAKDLTSLLEVHRAIIASLDLETRLYRLESDGKPGKS
jgi:hypothetical protein